MKEYLGSDQSGVYIQVGGEFTVCDGEYMLEEPEILVEGKDIFGLLSSGKIDELVSDACDEMHNTFAELGKKRPAYHRSEE